MIFIIGILLIIVLIVVTKNTYERECIILKLTPEKTFTLLTIIGFISGCLFVHLIYKLIG